MADLHYCEMTIKTRLVIPATDGAATPIHVANIPQAVRVLLHTQLASYGAAVALPTVDVSEPLEVPA